MRTYPPKPSGMLKTPLASATGGVIDGGGTCKVYSSGHMTDLLTSHEQENPFGLTSTAGGAETLKLPKINKEDELRASQTATRVANAKKYRELEEQIARDTERRIREKAKRRDVAFQEMFSKVAAGLDGKDALLNGTSDDIRLWDEAMERKRVQMHQDWEDNVFARIQEAVKNEVDGRSVEEIEARLRERYQEFIDAGNTKRASHPKAGIYRDIVIESDYDPFVAKQAIIRTKPDIADPMKKDLERAAEERRQLNAYLHPNFLPRNAPSERSRQRETLASEFWSDLGATPYGHFSNTEFGDIETDRDALSHHGRSVGDKRSESHVPMDQYNIPTDAPDELPKTKKMVGGVPHVIARGESASMAEVLAAKDADTLHRDLLASGRHIGDLYLSARGKRQGNALDLAPSLVSRKEGDMAGILAHEAKQRFPADTCGDWWEEAKGKHICPKPEEKMARGEVGFFPIIQATDVEKTNREKKSMGITYGDTDLEARTRKPGEFAPKGQWRNPMDHFDGVD